MLSEKIQQALNRQITFEYAASYTYLAIAAYFPRIAFPHRLRPLVPRPE